MRISLLRLLAFCTVFSLIVVAEAQQSNYAPTYHPGPIRNIQWMLDNQAVKIEVETAISPLESITDWYLYTLSSNSLIPTTISPSLEAQGILAHNLIAPLAINSFNQRPGLFFLSPNGRFAAYPVEIGQQQSYHFALFDFDTEQTQILEEIRPKYPDSPELFRVKWSDDSRAIVVTLSDADGGILNYYISLSSETLSSVEVIDFQNPDNIFNSATGGQISELYDIDPTGEFLLVDGTIPASATQQQTDGLFILDMSDFSATVVNSGGGESPAFNRSDSTKVNYMRRAGVYEYDRSTGVTRLRNADINTSWLDVAAFSPNGRYIAGRHIDNISDLYILEIEPISLPEGCDAAPQTSQDLIGAIHAGNSASAPYTICLVPGATYTLNNYQGDFYGNTGLPSITGQIIIKGNGATIERNTDAATLLFRLFGVDSNAELTLENLTLRGGALDVNAGAAIVNVFGTVTLDDVVLENNQALSADDSRGGAIYNYHGTLNVTNSLLQNNTAPIKHLHVAVFYAPELYTKTLPWHPVRADPTRIGSYSRKTNDFQWFYTFYDLGAWSPGYHIPDYGRSILVNELVLWPSAQQGSINCLFWKIDKTKSSSTNLDGNKDKNDG